LLGTIKCRVYEAYSIAKNIFKKQRDAISIDEIKGTPKSMYNT